MYIYLFLWFRICKTRKCSSLLEAYSY